MPNRRQRLPAPQLCRAARLDTLGANGRATQPRPLRRSLINPARPVADREARPREVRMASAASSAPTRRRCCRDEGAGIRQSRCGRRRAAMGPCGERGAGTRRSTTPCPTSPSSETRARSCATSSTSCAPAPARACSSRPRRSSRRAACRSPCASSAARATRISACAPATRCTRCGSTRSRRRCRRRWTPTRRRTSRSRRVAEAARLWSRLRLGGASVLLGLLATAASFCQSPAPNRRSAPSATSLSPAAARRRRPERPRPCRCRWSTARRGAGSGGGAVLVQAGPSAGGGRRMLLRMGAGRRGAGRGVRRRWAAARVLRVGGALRGVASSPTRATPRRREGRACGRAGGRGRDGQPPSG